MGFQTAVSHPRIADPTPSVLEIRNFKGINVLATEAQIAVNETPDALNIQLDDVGAIEKRVGYMRVIQGLNNKVNGMGTCGSNLLIEAGTEMYVTPISSIETITASAPVTLSASLTGLANTRTQFFNMLDKCYFINGTSYKQYDDGVFSDVTSKSTIPTITLGRGSAGGGTANEAVNLLQPGFIDSFSATGGSTFQMSFGYLDTASLTAVVNGVSMAEGSGFTVNRTTGLVTFSTPPASGTDNLRITAYKTVNDTAEVVTLTITAAATASGNVQIRLDGTIVDVAIVSGDSTTTVASKIASASYTGWSASATSAVITFTATTFGPKLDMIYDPRTTGALGTVVTTIEGQYSYPNRILNCTIVQLFGGDNDTRVFMAGNPSAEFKNVRFHSELYDPSYFPDVNFTKIGSDNASIKGFAKQFNTQVILKEKRDNDTPIWSSNYYLSTADGTVSFPVQPINDSVGCNASDSIQMVENTPYYLDSLKGVHLLAMTNVRDQRNVKRISDEINKLLLAESSIENAQSAVYKYRYMLSDHQYP